MGAAKLNDMNKKFARILEVEGQQILYRIDLNDNQDEVIKATIYDGISYEMTLGPFKSQTVFEVLEGITQQNAENFYKSWKTLIKG